MTAQPELTEPWLAAPGLTDLSFRDWRAVFVRAAKRMLDDNMTMIASALAYSTLLRDPVRAADGRRRVHADRRPRHDRHPDRASRPRDAGPGHAAAARQPSPPRPEPVGGARDDRGRPRPRALVDVRRDDDVHDRAQPRLRARGPAEVRHEEAGRARDGRRASASRSCSSRCCSSSGRRSRSTWGAGSGWRARSGGSGGRRSGRSWSRAARRVRDAALARPRRRASELEVPDAGERRRGR